jgi:hypothetical protein
METHRATQEPEPGTHTLYEILIASQIDGRWSEWFEGLTITLPTANTSRLRGPLADQAALFGVLKKIHNLGLVLLSVARLESPDAEPQSGEKGA